jgi:hypothetical protein
MWPNRDPLGDLGYGAGKKVDVSNVARLLKRRLSPLDQRFIVSKLGFLGKLKRWEAMDPTLLSMDLNEGNLYEVNLNNDVSNVDPSGEFTWIEATVAAVIAALIAEGLYDAWERSHSHGPGVCPATPPPPPDDGGDDFWDPNFGDGEGGVGEGPAAP